MKCPSCGAEIDDSAAFCPECGAKITGAEQTWTAQNAGNANYSSAQPINQGYNAQQADQRYSAPAYNMGMQQIPPEYTPISMWGYFGYELLFNVPVVGFIFLIIYSFGGTQNKNLKNFARSYFCFIVIMFILLMVIIAICGAAAVGSVFNRNY